MFNTQAFKSYAEAARLYLFISRVNPLCESRANPTSVTHFNSSGPYSSDPHIDPLSKNYLLKCHCFITRQYGMALNLSQLMLPNSNIPVTFVLESSSLNELIYSLLEEVKLAQLILFHLSFL